MVGEPHSWETHSTFLELQDSRARSRSHPKCRRTRLSVPAQPLPHSTPRDMGDFFTFKWCGLYFNVYIVKAHIKLISVQVWK